MTVESDLIRIRQKLASLEQAGQTLFISYNDGDLSGMPVDCTGDGTANGWYTDYDPVAHPTQVPNWMSIKRSSSIDTGTWSSPMAIHGAAGATGAGGNFIDHVFARAATIPTTPTGNGLPAGWLDAPPIADSISNGGLEVWTGGDSVAPTGWTLLGTGGTIAKESSIKKAGNYSAKLTRVGTDTQIYQTIHTSLGIAYWKGKKVTFGCWVYASSSSAARIALYDGVTATYSSYHTGATGWEFLTVSMVISSSATTVYLVLMVDTDGSAYFDEASTEMPLWMAVGEKTSADVLVGSWSSPVQLDGESGDSVSVEYSIDGTTLWHSAFAEGDIYMRQAVGTGAWSDAIRIVGEQGEAGTNGTNGTNGEDGVDGSAWSNDIPEVKGVRFAIVSGNMRWTAGTVDYDGATHTVAAETTGVNKNYFYWNHASPTVIQSTDVLADAIDVASGNWLLCQRTGGKAVPASAHKIIIANSVLAATLSAINASLGNITGGEIILTATDGLTRWRLDSTGLYGSYRATTGAAWGDWKGVAKIIDGKTVASFDAYTTAETVSQIYTSALSFLETVYTWPISYVAPAAWDAINLIYDGRTGIPYCQAKVASGTIKGTVIVSTTDTDISSTPCKARLLLYSFPSSTPPPTSGAAGGTLIYTSAEVDITAINDPKTITVEFAGTFTPGSYYAGYISRKTASGVGEVVIDSYPQISMFESISFSIKKE
jgi:hypothetical protein